MEQLGSVLTNSVTHITSSYGRNSESITPSKLIINYYLSSYLPPNTLIKHITTTFNYDAEGLQSINKRFTESINSSSQEQNNLAFADRLEKVIHTRCFSLREILKEIEEIQELSYDITSSTDKFGLIVIEDLYDVFNLDDFKNHVSASELLIELFRKLRKLAQVFELSVVILERNQKASYNSQSIQKYVSMLYDYELKIEELDQELGDVTCKVMCNFNGKSEEKIHMGLDVFA